MRKNIKKTQHSRSRKVDRKATETRTARASSRKIRYAVIGLGHVAQAAMLPSFKHASKNSELVALISSDALKLKKLGKRYGVKHLFNYAEYREALSQDIFDAVYIALPNSLHRDFTIEAARFGKHILCEKPLAVSSQHCREMIEAAKENNVKLMTAYRLHFDKANMEMAKLAQSGKIGESKIFTSSFSYQIKAGNSRLSAELGGGVLYDIGIYCINAARYIFKDEPIEVSAAIPVTNDPRFQEVEGTICALMRFPNGKTAQFVCSFASEPTSWYEVLGTKGNICVDAAYEYRKAIECDITVKEKTSHRRFQKRDQFAPELLYFSDCIQRDIVPEPSGTEGLADVCIIEALLQSAHEGRFVEVSTVSKERHAESSQVITRPPISREPSLVRVESAGS